MQSKTPLTERDSLDIIQFDEQRHGDELKKNLNLEGCPSDLHETVIEVIKHHWDAFAEEGMLKTVRGVKFHIDTGQSPPICCKQREYGAHESRVITKLCKEMEKNGFIEDDDGPWGSRVVLAQKPDQGHKHWTEYIWRLCVSYRPLNAITRPFTFPAPRCDNAILDLGPTSVYITMDMKSGYWQIEMTESSKCKTAFFVPKGKKRFSRMPMGATNAHPFFVALAVKLEKEWTQKALQEGLPEGKFTSAIIVDDIMLAATDIPTLQKLFRCCLAVLIKYRVTLQLRKCRFFIDTAEFVGYDVLKNGNAPAHSKFEALTKLTRPHLVSDLRMLIGVFGFYQQYIEWYEQRISRWRSYCKGFSKSNQPSIEDEKHHVDSVWTKEDDELLEQLKQEITIHPILARPDLSKRFYLKTDWSKWAFGAALCQPSDEDTESMTREIHGGECEFDLTIDGKRLVPLFLISRKTTDREKHDHSSVGEAKAGNWAFGKFHRWLFGAQFTWITDSIRMKEFLDNVDDPSHQCQRMRMNMLRYDARIVHRPEHMMKEVDAASRYNRKYEEWEQLKTQSQNAFLLRRYNIRAARLYNLSVRDDITTPLVLTASIIQEHQTGIKARPIEWNMTAPKIVGHISDPKTLMAAAIDKEKNIWILGSNNTTIAAILDLGWSNTEIQTVITSDRSQWKCIEDMDIKDAIEGIIKTKVRIDWFFINGKECINTPSIELTSILSALLLKDNAPIISIFEPSENVKMALAKIHLKKHHVREVSISNREYGGYIDNNMRCILVINQEYNRVWEELPTRRQNELGTIADITDELYQVINPREFIRFHRCEKTTTSQATKAKHKSRIIMQGNVWSATSMQQEFEPVYDEDHPMPANKPNFLIYTSGPQGTMGIRAIRPSELGRAVGLCESDIQHWITNYDEETVRGSFINMIPSDCVATIALHLYKMEKKIQKARNKTDISRQLEDTADDPIKYVALLTQKVGLNPYTTIPTPTEAEWQKATSEDPDLEKIIRANARNITLKKADLIRKEYFSEWNRGTLEVQEGIVYQYEEPKKVRIRQLKRRVVPAGLRRIIIAAYHASPTAGHTGFYKTYFQIALRFWWPNMAAEIREGVNGCILCRLANSASHKEQQILTALSCDQPFDVIALDVWSPGSAIDNIKEQKVLTCVCTMTGYASVAIIENTTAATIAKHTFASFIVPNGLPRMVLVDAGSEFKGELKQMLEVLGIQHIEVSPENHNGILCERFHRYLNKIQRIHAAETNSLFKWVMGTMFATYAWNAAPIDGTDIIRSYAAKARTFQFPIDTTMNNPPRIPAGEGQAAIDHTTFNIPLWSKQLEILQILNDERRQRHRDLKNASKTKRTFNVGDLVLVRRQIKSVQDEGIVGKLKFKAKGPFRVIGAADENSYLIQKIPATEGDGVPGKVRKEAAMRLERIPSRLVLHKRIDGTDVRLASMTGPLSHMPAANEFGVRQYGSYRASTNQEFAFEKIKEIWNEEISDDSSNDDETDDDGRTGSDNGQTNNNKNSTTDEAAEDSEDDIPITSLKRKWDQKRNKKDETKKQKQNKTTTNRRQELYDRITKSNDRLCIIAETQLGSPKKKWFVVQVDMDETDPYSAQQFGTYHCRWWIPKQDDAKQRNIKDCRFWPEIHELRQGIMGDMVMFRPARVNKILNKKNSKWVWYQRPINLMDDLVAGPFDFTPISTTNPEHNRIPITMWNQLLTHDNKVDTSDLHRPIYQQTPSS
jgi:hypothetical protein